ncbi:hypothetical protein ACIQMJ_27205 [Actinosynnema sp. NPDC091369]
MTRAEELSAEELSSVDRQPVPADSSLASGGSWPSPYSHGWWSGGWYTWGAESHLMKADVR